MVAASSLCTFPSPRVPAAAGVLSCLGGFSPDVPAHDTTERGELDADLAHLQYDPDLQAKIMRRRQQARERDSLKITPRILKTGLDIVSLNTQVAMKKAQVEAHAHDDDGYIMALECKGKLCDAVEAQHREKLKQQHKDCVNFSLSNLRNDQRREWELSDPNRLKRDRYPRQDGDKVAMSSMQKFEGEQSASAEAIRERKRSQAAWLLAQVNEKKNKEQTAMEIDRRFDEALVAANELRVAIEVEEEKEIKEGAYETAKQNVVLASARATRREAARAKDLAATDRHVMSARDHNLQRERHDFDIGLNGKKRDYKRCSRKEEIDVWNTNANIVKGQIAEKRRLEHVDDKYLMLGLAIDALGKLSEDEYAKQNTRRRKEFDAANVKIAQEQREMRDRERAAYRPFTIQNL